MVSRGDEMIELDELRVEAEACTRCRLSESRTNVVFGVGSPQAEVMFVGEAPGRNEDLEGEPFVGRAGQLLDQLLGEIGIDRQSVYIANVLKCRPPNNRDPLPDEIECCKGYLRQQIRLIRPRVVVTLGNFATKLLLRTTTGITRLRGRSYPWWLESTVVPTFHPAAALRGGDRVANNMRDDFKLIRSILDRPVEEVPESTGGESQPYQARLWT